MFITGIDEVGRGAIAGPIVSASFKINYALLKQLQNEVLNYKEKKTLISTRTLNKIERLENLISFDVSYFKNKTKALEVEKKINIDTVETLIELNDSKKLTQNNKEKLAELLTKIGEFKLGVVSSMEIDNIGIQMANYNSLLKTISNHELNSLILLDHYKLPSHKFSNINSVTKGDMKSFTIAASSVIAKLYRDYLMYEYHKLYPPYKFNEHVGYGTKSHLQAIEQNGSCKIHRISYKLFRNK